MATRSGFVFLAFIIVSVFADDSLKAMKTMATDMTLDALEKALWARKVKGTLIHHSDTRIGLPRRESRRLWVVLAMRTTMRLLKTIIGLFKPEIIYKRSPWKNFDALEYATLDWIS